MRTLRYGWVALLALAALAPPASANFDPQGGDIGGVGEGLKTYTCSTLGGCENVLGAVVIKGFKLIAKTAPSACTLYDGTASGTDSQVVDELSESTANDTDAHIWPQPYKLDRGLSITVTGAGSVCIVYY